MVLHMMKRIMTPRAAAVAFAASALVATPALADPGKGSKHTHNKPLINGALQVDIGDGLSLTLANGGWDHGYYGHRGQRHYGNQDRRRLKQLRREAIRACKRAVRYEARDRGFRRVFLDDVERVRQIGPRGFVVRAEFEFEGRRRDFERDVTCTVRRGRVVDIDNLPRGRGNRHRGYGNNNYGYNNHGYNDYGYHNNEHLRGGKSKKKAY